MQKASMRGRSIAKCAKIDFEQETSQKVVIGENFLSPIQEVKKVIKKK